MIISQVTVTVENKDGKLKEVMDILGANDINVEALSMADTVTRLIVADPQGCAKLLCSHGYEVELTDVLRVRIPSRAGALAQMLVNVAEEHINLEYMYAFATGNGDELIIRPSDVQRTDELLKDWE